MGGVPLPKLLRGVGLDAARTPGGWRRAPRDAWPGERRSNMVGNY